MRSWSSHSGLYSFSQIFWYNIMIKVNQHALINLVYMVTKVFNIQPLLFHQYYLCHLLWFKKQSFTFVWKPNLPLGSVRLHLRAPADAVSVGSTHKALPLKVHLSTWSVKSDSCYNVLWLCSAQEQQTMHLHKCDHVNFFTGGVVRLTAKPRYLLLLHRGNEKYNTVTALVSAHTWLSLWLSLLSTCSWCVVSAYTWLALWLSLSSPPVAGVWWEHTLDCLYESLSSPPVAGVWWEHTLDWL